MEDTTFFQVAVKATERELESKKKKKVDVDADWVLSIDYEACGVKILELAREIGRNDGYLSWGTQAEKSKAKKATPKLEKEAKRLRNLDAVKIMDLQFKLDDEIEQLSSELRVLNNMSHKHPRSIF